MANYKNTSRVYKVTLDSNFTQIPNETLQDTSLSPEEVYLICNLCSRPEDWTFVKTEYWKQTSLGRDRFFKTWSKLESKGYIRAIKRMEGNLIRYDYQISYLPIFQSSVTLNSVNREVGSIIIKKTNKENKERELAAASITKLPKGNLVYSNAVAAVQNSDAVYYNEEKMNEESPLVGDSHHIYNSEEFMRELLMRLSK